MYVKCPVCGLNYITEGEGMCKVCRTERKLSIKEVEELLIDDDSEQEICPECGEYYLKPGQEMCDSCQAENEKEEEEAEELQLDEWKDFLPPEDNGEILDRDDCEDPLDFMQEVSLEREESQPSL